MHTHTCTHTHIHTQTHTHTNTKHRIQGKVQGKTVYTFSLHFSSLSTVVHLYISIHAVSCSKVSMNESLFCKVLHSLCYINAHLNQDLQTYTLDREDSKPLLRTKLNMKS